MSDKVAVKREGGRGWHFIAADSYDPKVHDKLSDAELAKLQGAVEKAPLVSEEEEVKLADPLAGGSDAVPADKQAASSKAKGKK